MNEKGSATMAYKNQVPNLTPRAKAARRRSLIASAVLFAVAATAIGLTIFVWVTRTAGG